MTCALGLRRGTLRRWVTAGRWLATPQNCAIGQTGTIYVSGLPGYDWPISCHGGSLSTNSTSTPLSPPPVTRLEEAKERVLDLSLDLVCIAGMDGWLRYVNPAWEQTLGWSREELLSRPFLDFIHPDDHAKSGAEVDSLAAGRPTTNFENRYLHRDGSLRTISWKATPSRDERLIFCIGRDVTAQRRAEARAARQLRLLAAINHVLRTTLTSASEERLAVACLAAAEEITGSRFGFIDQLNARGLFDVVAISDPGWAACRMANPRAELRDIAFRGLHSQVIAEGRSLLFNAPARHPAWCGVPEGHPLIECYLATPLRDGERLFGMMAVAN
ncbi:MAG: PAS domain S-box protein, partial [Deltaproteobacteria bacterium]|nr:PAS domain S-box protein [Deltaproteobacteria bacterium]